MFMSLTLVMIPVINTLEVKGSSIVEVLAWKDDSIQVARMSIGNGVTYS